VPLGALSSVSMEAIVENLVLWTVFVRCAYRSPKSEGRRINEIGLEAASGDIRHHSVVVLRGVMM